MLRGRPLACGLCIAALVLPAQAEDDDALNLAQDAIPELQAALPPAAGSPVRLTVEGAAGRWRRRESLGALATRRLSIDLSHSFRGDGGWRLGWSNRIDAWSPVEPGQGAALNSLREAYASWQDPTGASLVEFGRIKLRESPAYGFNPTDYWRAGSLRAITSADPFALRDARLGTVMLRMQRWWPGSAWTLAWAPKLADRPSPAPLSLDLGSTNASHRLLASWSPRGTERVNGQAMLFVEQGQRPQLGANLSALFSDALVGHGEVSVGRAQNELLKLQGLPSPEAFRGRLASGLTWTLPQGLALTAEVAYNGAAPDRAAWEATATPAAQVQYLGLAGLRQDSASRRAWLLYLVQKNLVFKRLDLTGFVRRNVDDGSQLAWLELRHHGSRLDLALQWQATRGRDRTEYGLLPVRQSIQGVGRWFY